MLFLPESCHPLGGSLHGTGSPSTFFRLLSGALENGGVGDTPHGVALNDDIGRLYVANHDDTLTIVNSATFSLISDVAVGDSPSGVADNPANSMIYFANRDDNAVTVLRASNHQLI